MKDRQIISVLGRRYESELVSAIPADLELNTIPAIQLLHERKMAERRQVLTEKTANMFKLSRLEDLPINEDVPDDEIEAERIVSHKRIVITDREMNVIHGHESVLKAALEKNCALIVLRIVSALSTADTFLIQVRHAAKEGQLFPAIRMEAIRLMHDEHGLNLKQIQSMLVGPRCKKPTQKEVGSELKVGRLFERYPGYRIPFIGHELDKRAFSNLKYLVGNNAIYEEMEGSKDKEKHFLHMAINAAKTRSKRLNSEVPPLMKHEDTRHLLFSEGLPQAKELLRAKYPEENFEHHPQNDLIAANEKLRRTDTLVLIKGQLDANPQGHQLFRQVLDLNMTISEISPLARKELMRSLISQAPEDCASLLVQAYPEIAAQELQNANSRLSRLLKGLK